MPPTSDAIIIQTAVSKELAVALKVYAAMNDMLLFDVFVEAMDRFISYSQLLHKKRQSVPYLVSPKGSKDFNVRIPEKLARRLQKMADEDQVPLRRLAYTALIHLAVGENLIPPVGTVLSGVVDRNSPSIAEMVRDAKRRRGGRS